MTSADTGDAKRTAEAVLKRDRRRVRSLAVLTIGLWVISALLIAGVYLPLGGKMKQYAQVLAADHPELAQIRFRARADQPPATGPATLPAEQIPTVLARVQQEQFILTKLIMGQWVVGAIILMFALAAGLLASVSTVALTLILRRTTLRQVSLSLAEISEQLRLLREQRPSC